MNRTINIDRVYRPEEVVESLSHHILIDETHHVIAAEGSLGVWFYDKAMGRPLLDCYSQYASLPLGYNHPDIRSAMDRHKFVANYKLANSDLYSDEYATFVNKLFGTLPGTSLKHGFFIEGGAAAVENALKVAFDWKARKKGLTDEQAQKLDIVHFKEAFHGRSGYTMSITDTGSLKTDYFPRFPWTRVNNPKIGHPFDVDQQNMVEDAALKDIERAMEKGMVAAVIIEPLQGQGGNNLFRPTFFSQLRRLCDAYEALLIFDEIQTGLGSSGRWWYFEHTGIVPDIVVFGKKTQVCGIMVSTKIDDVKDNCFALSGRIDSTWGGNIADMVRCSTIIDVIRRDNLLNNTLEVGEHILSGLRELEKEFPQITNVRGVGTLLAFDMPSTEHRDRLLGELRKSMLILPCGSQSIRLRTALTFGKQHANNALSYLREALWREKLS